MNTSPACEVAMHSGRRRQLTPTIGLPVNSVTRQELPLVGSLEVATIPAPRASVPPIAQIVASAHEIAVGVSGPRSRGWERSLTRCQARLPPAGSWE